MATLQPTANATPGRRLSQMLKVRRKRGDGTSIHSSANSDGSSRSTSDLAGDDGRPKDSNAKNEKRSSVDATIDKIKQKAKDSLDRGSSEVGRRGSVRRTVRKLAHRDDDSENEASKRTSALFLDESFDLSNGDAPMKRPDQSEDSLLLHKSPASSLLTDDDESQVKEGPPIRPSLTPRHSHKDYLTLSSPSITSEILDPPPQLTTIAVSTVPADNLAPTHAKTLEARPSSRRSPSPVNKLKEAFVPRRSTTPRPDSDNQSEKSVGSGGGAIGNIFGGKKGTSRRGSKASEESLSRSADEPPVPVLPANVKSFRGRRGSNGLEKISTAPVTPPQLLHAPPETLVTPPTPTEPRPGTAPEALSKPGISASSGVNGLSHRRGRSGTNPPSKLSNSITPLTPFVEEAKTPGGTVTAPNQTNGFFSSVFSAAQNAASSLSSIANSSLPNNKINRGSNPTASAEQDKATKSGGEEVVGGGAGNTEEAGGVKRQLAIETLGSGNLSLSHLGITDSPEAITMAPKTDTRDPALATSQNESASARAEDNAAAQAVSAAYASEKSGFPENDAPPRPRSINSIPSIQTPPRTHSTGPDLGRSGSVRSRFSGGGRRRHRGSSATTGGAISAAIGASTATLANPLANTQKLTGFAVASPKRNRDFHQLFRSVPEDDYLIEDYSAALQRDILLHGRLYVSEGHICFSSNILGWVTNLVISFDEVVTVEKKSTAVIFPNAIVIQTLHARNVFASFVTRDSTYDLLIGIWKINHPNLKSSLNGVTIDSGTGDKTEKTESIAGTDGTSEGEGGSDDEVYDEDEEDEDGLGSFTEANEGSIAGSDVAPEPAVSRKASAAISAAATTVQNGNAKIIDQFEAAATGAAVSTDFPGPATHATTACGDEASHYETVMTDATIPAPLGKVYSMMFGPASGTWMRKFLVDDQKSRDLQMEDDKKGLGEDKKTFGYSFIKPLNASIGPRQTKCIINQTLEQFDLEKAVTVDCSTQNPDVPSGNAFLVKTKYCLMWAPGNSTRLIMTCTIEWSAKSWLKGPIEKGTNDGQTQYAKDLVAALKAAVTAKVAPKGAAPRGRVKGKKKDRSGDPGESGNASASASSSSAVTQSQGNWGLFEPLHGPLGPVVDILKGIASSPITVVVLSLLLVWVSLRQSPGAAVGAYGGASTPQRLAAYEEMWRREESELWHWLEERVSMDRAIRGIRNNDNEWATRQKITQVQSKIETEILSETQMDEAIRVTQERLDTLRQAVQNKKERKENGKTGVGSLRTGAEQAKTRPTEKVHIEL